MKRLAALIPLLLLAGCGGTVVSPASGNNTSSPVPLNSPTVPASATAVTVGAGQTASSIDIAVAAPAGTPAPNAQNLGVAALTGPGSATNTGDIIHRGQTARILLFGPGLTGDMQVNIRGTADIVISDIHSIMATNNTPGIAFTAVVAPDAVLGARSVVLQSPKGDITTFTGGLEVVP